MIQLAPIKITYAPDPKQKQDMPFLRSWFDKQDFVPAPGWEFVFYDTFIEHRKKDEAP